MPTRSKTPLVTARTTRSGRIIRPVPNISHPSQQTSARATSKRGTNNDAVQPLTAVRKTKPGAARQRKSNEEEFVLDSSEDESEGEELEECEEEIVCSIKEAPKAWESGSRRAHHMGLVMERAEGRRKGMRIRELEDEVKKLNKSLQSVNNAPQKLLDLRVTHNSVKDELERMKMKNAAHRREITELKAVESGAVANLKLQYQTDNMDATIKMKQIEIDLAAEKRMRIGLEADLKVERSIALKLRAKLDDLLVAEVKSGKVLETMGEKARMKRDEKDAKFNHSHAVVDRAIAVKGRGRGRGSRSANKKKKGKVSRDKEREARNAFEEWTRRGVGDRDDFSDSDDYDSLGDYTSDESSVSSSDGGSSSCNNRRKRRRNPRGSQKKRRSRSRGKKRRSSTSRRRKSKKSRRGRRATIDLSSDDSSAGRSFLATEEKRRSATSDDYNVVDAGSVTGYSGTTFSVNVCKSVNRDVNARLSLSSTGADDACA